MLRRNIPLNYRNITGVASSHKDDSSTPFESPLERDFIELLRFDVLSVKSYQTQRPVIFYFEGDKKRRYTPDVFVEYEDGRRVMYEVKPRDSIRKNWLKLKPKFKQAIRYGKERGYSFRLVTEVEIRTPYLKNVKFLSTCKLSGDYDPRYKRLIESLRLLEVSTPTELIASIAKSRHEQAELLHTLWRLVADNIVGVDLHEPLTMNSPIWYRLEGDCL